MSTAYLNCLQEVKRTIGRWFWRTNIWVLQVLPPILGIVLLVVGIKIGENLFSSTPPKVYFFFHWVCFSVLFGLSGVFIIIRKEAQVGLFHYEGVFPIIFGILLIAFSIFLIIGMRISLGAG
jgi:hypothetical protein